MIIYFYLGNYPECMGVTLTIGPEAYVSSSNVHAEMYALAGKYDIKGLKKISVQLT